MRRAIILLCAATAFGAVRSWEGTVTIPTYEPSARETEPPLFTTSAVTGMYPFTTYLPPYQPGGPKAKTYQAIFLDNEYLKLTYIPEFGGRFFSVFDKLRNREMFYRNDVIKPSGYNPRNSWPQSGVELTGPHDLHMLTLHGEPFWANRIVTHADGSVSLVLGALDPVYQMKVNLSATLHPGVAALEIGVFCYNTRDARMPQMLWINSAISATPETRFIYPMSRTVGHTTADIADWPVYNGVDYSLDRNNQHMLGVFGIDIYDNFQGAYQFDRDYGIFRHADRRIVQGMKMWTFGYGPAAKGYERGYTDNAGPYVELQSGRHVWDGHYEWVAPHKVESWTEWWVPVAGTGGVTTLTRDVALKLAPDGVTLASTGVVHDATLRVAASSGELLRRTIELAPEKPLHLEVPLNGASGVTVTITGANGQILLDYQRPDGNPGRKEYTPFTKPLEKPPKSPDSMSAEELTLAAEFKFKELAATAATTLLDKALERDPGFSRAHLLYGIHHFTAGRHAEAVRHLEQALERDPYASEAYYYLAMSQFALGQDLQAERNLYFIWPDSPYYGEREYHLARLHRGAAVAHLERAIAANACDLSSRLLLAIVHREDGNRAEALKQLGEIERIDPTNRPARAERMFLGDTAAKADLLRLMGGQSQEAIGVSSAYRYLARWKEATEILKLAAENNRDPWGTTPEFYYILAYCQRRTSGPNSAPASIKRARAAQGNIDRFPYREDSEAPLAEAVKVDRTDGVAHFALACLLYYRGRPAEALQHFQSAAELEPKNFSARRALGLAYAEQGAGIDKAAAELEKAIELNPTHVRTFNDLSALYARAGRFDEQFALLSKALARSPADDDLAEGVLTANLIRGDYAGAQRLIESHPFTPRHRTYGLRDKYRVLCYGLGARAFRNGNFAEALRLFDAALAPPVSLGVDDFASQSSPRIEYYRGRGLEALGKSAGARQAYEKSASGSAQLSGDRDSWNSENFFMTLSLDRLGRSDEAAGLRKRFENFANGEAEDKSSHRRAEARYLLGLLRKQQGKAEEARRWMTQAAEALPDLLPARLELRGDALDPLEVKP